MNWGYHSNNVFVKLISISIWKPLNLGKSVFINVGHTTTHLHALERKPKHLITIHSNKQMRNKQNLKTIQKQGTQSKQKIS